VVAGGCYVIWVGNRDAGGILWGHESARRRLKLKEEHDACARRVGLRLDCALRRCQSPAAGPVAARAGVFGKHMPAFTMIQVLVVTLRAAWFNFRGCNKRR